MFSSLTDTPQLTYNIHMQDKNADGCNERKLTCQVNVRMTPEMREHLESAAKDNWTSASQIARLAVAKELDRMDGTDETVEVEEDIGIIRVGDDAVPFWRHHLTWTALLPLIPGSRAGLLIRLVTSRWS